MKRIVIACIAGLTLALQSACGAPAASSSSAAASSEGAGAAVSTSSVAEADASPESVVSNEAASVDASASVSADAQASSGKEGGLLAKLEWPVSDVTEGVPAPDFGVAPTEVNQHDSDYLEQALVTYENVDEGTVAAYIEELKAAGFVENVNESSTNESYQYHASLPIEPAPATQEIDGEIVTVPRSMDSKPKAVSVSFYDFGDITYTDIAVGYGSVASGSRSAPRS